MVFLACRYLLSEQSRLRSVNDIMPMIGARFYTQLDASQMRNDVIEEDLAKVLAFIHLHSDRLFFSLHLIQFMKLTHKL